MTAAWVPSYVGRLRDLADDFDRLAHAYDGQPTGRHDPSAVFAARACRRVVGLVAAVHRRLLRRRVSSVTVGAPTVVVSGGMTRQQLDAALAGWAEELAGSVRAGVR